MPTDIETAEKNFEQTRQVLKDLVQELSKDQAVIEKIKSSNEDVGRQNVIVKALESSLLGKEASEAERKALDYQNVIEEVPLSSGSSQMVIPKQRWIALINSYQFNYQSIIPEIKPAGYINPNGPTYKQLKKDVRKRLLETPLKSQEPILPTNQTTESPPTQQASLSSDPKVLPSKPADERFIMKKEEQ